ncbi:MAG: Tim44-like domain-containing protein, partial [Proteobacteria bacterium]|nr:Tim44-like domain-containing protein [Pseudomonadota bacterium]
AIHKIKGNDVNFKPKEFLARVESAFMIVQNSWSTGNLIPMRPFSSDGVYERFSIQLEDLKAQKLKNKLSDIKIQSCKIYSHDIDGKYESTTVELSASMKDEYLNEKGKTVKSSPAEFTEYWTFTRFVGVKTKNTKGLLEGCCPECTVPVVMNQHAKCPACNVILRSGEFDWVLTEITQEVSDTDSEISFDEIENVRQKDPYFSVQLLEDHASVIFWRMMTTRRTKNLKVLESVAQSDLCQTIADLPVRTDIGVGSVELTGFERMPNQLVAKIHVKWMAKTNPKEPSERFASDMVLIRRDNAQSELQNKMGSLHCKSCGLAVGDVVDSNCSGCGTTIKDEGRQWILAGWETLKSTSIESKAA